MVGLGTSSAKKGSQMYKDLLFLIFSSNVCESLFSKTGYSLNDCRREVSPADLKYKLFVYKNNNLWTAQYSTNLSIIDEIA